MPQHGRRDLLVVEPCLVAAAAVANLSGIAEVLDLAANAGHVLVVGKVNLRSRRAADRPPLIVADLDALADLTACKYAQIQLHDRTSSNINEAFPGKYSESPSLRSSIRFG
jgi:hypothetical protein